MYIQTQIYFKRFRKSGLAGAKRNGGLLLLLADDERGGLLFVEVVGRDFLWTEVVFCNGRVCLLIAD